MQDPGEPRLTRRPDYRAKNSIPGIHNQAWSPVDDWYHTFGGGNALRFYVLLEDMLGNGPAKAKWVYREDNTSRGVNDVYGFDNLLDGAQAGHKGVYAKIDGEWVPPVHPCIEECDHGGQLNFSGPFTGTVDEPIASISQSSTGLNSGSVAASGLPPGLSIDSSTGAITGTPTESGEFGVTITATAPKTSGIGNCTLTRYIIITIS